MSIVSIGRATGLIGALGLAALLSASSASAQVSTQAVNAINAKRSQVASSLATAYFQTAVSRAPVAGQNNTGAYQTYRGTSGSGSIYWSQSTGAHIIYGDILKFFTNNGMEVSIGYPSTDPQSGNGASYGCESDTTVFQTFSLVARPSSGGVTPRQMSTLCVSGRGKVSRGTLTFSGASTPRVRDVTRTDVGATREDDGRSFDEEAEEEDTWADEDEEDSWADEDEEETDVAPPRSASSGRSVGSRSSGSGILTPR